MIGVVDYATSRYYTRDGFYNGISQQYMAQSLGDDMRDEKQGTVLHLNSDQNSSYEDYERACDERRAENEEYLNEFEEWLKAAGLSDKTIQRHIHNVDFFINAYLLREKAYGMEEGCARMDDFLGYFFIRKCTWSTPTTIRQNATSFKKFYKCMLEKGHIARASYDVLLDDIKTCMPTWLASCEDFNNPSDDEYADLFGPRGMDFLDALYAGIAQSIGFGDLLDVGREPMPDIGMGHEATHEPGMGREPTPEYSQNEDDQALPTREEIIREFTLMLFYLTSWEEKGVAGPTHRAWKSADWDALDWLRKMDLISCTNKAKSVYLTDDGMKLAEMSLYSMGLEHLIEERDETGDDEGKRGNLRLV
ncbi:MAG: hypothetical protein IKG21_09755 [Atopobiaceae bacterium]|nr:hypothetical protein [Atopobiaceae bacterium]